MMKKSVLLFSIIFFFGLNNLFAQQMITYKDATEFNTTIEEIALYDSVNSTWLVISSSSRTFDIASVSPGAAVGQMAGSIGQIPAGTYTKLKIKISGAFTWKADGVTNGSGNFDFRSGGNAGENYTPYTNQTGQGIYANGSSGFVNIYDTPPLVFPIPEGVQASFRIDFAVEGVVISDSIIRPPEAIIRINGNLLGFNF